MILIVIFDLPFFLSFSPILLLVLLLFVFKRTLAFSSILTFVFTFALVFFYWGIDSSYLLPSFLKGLFISVDIGLIIFGAIFFVEFLKEAGVFTSLEYYLSKLSKDRRIQVLLIVWFFGSFVEGSSGFGTQSIIIAPILVALGFPIALSVILVLFNTSLMIVFGAVGTPIRIGFNGLNSAGVPYYTALISLIVGFFIPLMLVYFTVSYRKHDKWKSFFACLPFALWCALCLLVPFFLIALIAPSFPSLLAPLIGLLLIILSVKKGFLVPEDVWVFDHDKPVKIKDNFHSFRKVIAPYAILIALLIVGAFVFPSIPVTLITGVTYSFQVFNAGFAFLLSVFFMNLFFKIKSKYIREAFSISFKVLLKPFISILFISVFVQLMISSSFNSHGFPGMIQEIATLLQNVALPFLTPILGAFGGFIGGSATISNLLFGHLEVLAANSLALSVPIILSLQLVGAALGNMLTLTHIVAVHAALKIHGDEVHVLKKLFMPFLICLSLTAIIGLLLIYVF